MMSQCQEHGRPANGDAPDRLIEAGLRLLATCGYEGFSIRRLASAANVIVVAIGYYFGGKKGLFLETIRRMIAEQPAKPPLFPIDVPPGFSNSGTMSEPRSHHIDPEKDPVVRELLMEADRSTQRITAFVRLGLGLVLGSNVRLIGPKVLHDSWVLEVSMGLYLTLALLSLALSSKRLFRPFWAPVLIVLDVLWVYAVTISGLGLLQLPLARFIEMPPFLYIFIFIGLAGLRFTPTAMLAGLATFMVVDGTIISLYLAESLPWPLLDEHPLFQVGANVLRFIIVLATGIIAAMGSLRSRRFLARALAARRERDFVERTFGKFVPETVAHAIIADQGMLQPMQRTATILYTDIQGFTSVVEAICPQEAVDMLNAYFAALEQAISIEHGIITQFQGDAVLAVFNVPLDQPDHADRALRAARSIERVTQDQLFAGHRLTTRVGIATGQVVAGNVGGVERVSFTVHGDAVNLAARLQEKNKETGTRLLLAEETVAALSDNSALRPVGRVQVRGRERPASVYSWKE
jgi:adenylate cyclase